MCARALSAFGALGTATRQGGSNKRNEKKGGRAATARAREEVNVTSGQVGGALSVQSGAVSVGEVCHQ